MFKKINEFYKDFHQAGGQEKRSKNYRPRQGKYKTESFDFLALINSWESIVGKKLAKNSIPLKNTHKTLHILTNHSIYSSQLSFMQEVLKQKIADHFPSLKGKIDRFSFRVNETSFKEHVEKVVKSQKESVFKLHPESPEYKELAKKADELLEDLDNEEIRESLKSIYIQSFQKK